MAIAEMEHISFIGMQAQQDPIIKIFQGVQGVELVPNQEKKTHLEKAGDLQENKIIRNNDQLKMVRTALSIVSRFHKKSILKAYMAKKDCYSLLQLENKVKNSEWRVCAETIIDLDKQLQTARSNRKKTARSVEGMRAWLSLDVNPLSFSHLKEVKAVYGIVSPSAKERFTELLEPLLKEGVYYEEVFSNKNECAYFLLYVKQQDQEVEQVLKECAFSLLDYIEKQEPREAEAFLKKAEKDAVEKEEQALNELKKMTKAISTLQLAEECFYNLLLQYEAQQTLFTTESTFMLKGWVPVKEKKKLLKCLETQFAENTYYIAFETVQDEELSDVPIILQNKKVFAPFESLTEMYGMPVYGEIDPTPFMAPFYILFFGMMVADLGYGLVVFMGTLLAKRFLKLDKSMQRNMDFFFYLSISVSLWGIVYGSFMGMSMPFQLLSPTEDVITILILSLILGFIQIISGLILAVYGNLKKKDYFGSISDGFSWIAILIGLALVACGLLVLNSSVLVYIGVALAVIGALLVILVPVIQDRSKPKGILKGLYALYGATSYVSDLVSYSRLMALGISGASIAVAFNTILSYLPFGARITVGVVLAIFMHALNLFLSCLSAYVHGIRLQFVEYFSKFYSGGGRKFQPFKAWEKYVTIHPNDNDVDRKE